MKTKQQAMLTAGTTGLNLQLLLELIYNFNMWQSSFQHNSLGDM